MFETDTIAAISTALGNSGIHIIRISGDEAFDIIEKVFKKGKSRKDFNADQTDSHTIHYGFICYEGEYIDEVMVSIYKAPNSYTKEDVAEINCHGGSYVVKKILKILVKSGCRLATPGEFSKRAFLNGRIDLSQAEAVMELIQAQNETSLKSSFSQINGRLSGIITGIRDRLIHETAFIEAALDDPEHFSLDNYAVDTLLNVIRECKEDVDKLVGTFENGKIIKEGIDTTIVGSPNAGKSSLLNNLLNDDKAIVTDIPGTTRDIIEHSVNIGRITLNLIDTAGIHDTEDVIEKIGIEKTYSSIERAQLILLVIDSAKGISEEDLNIYGSIKEKPHIVVLNKSDISEDDSYDVRPFEGSRIVIYSTKTGEGYEELINMISDMFYNNDIDVENEMYITNVRHFELLSKASLALENVIEEIDGCVSEDILTIDIMDAYTYLGEIIGETVADDLVDKIFSEFCMGK